MARSHAEIRDELCAPGQLFEMVDVEIRGIPYRVWKNAPACLGDVLEQGKDTGGARDFIRLGDAHLTHADHYRQVTAFASRLVDEFGVVKGDRVAIAMRNYPEWSVAFFAATMVGAVAAPLNAFWNGSELAFGVTDADAKVLVADGERLERLAPHVRELGDVRLVGTRLDDRNGAAELPDGVVDFAAFTGLTEDAATDRPDVVVEPDDLATLFYTSGTQGRPKGVLGTHRNICTNLVNLLYVAARQRLRSGAAVPTMASAGAPVLLVPVPLFHATGCHSILVSQAYSGGTLVFMRKWDPEVALDLIEREGVTSVSGVPSMMWDLVNSPSLARRDLSRLTFLGGGGAASPPELLRRVDADLPQRGVSAGYGLTETSSVTSSISGEDYRRRPDSVGVPVPVCDVRIVADDGRDVAPGGVGEIWIRGPNVVPGYWRREEETAAAFTDGWLHSGDIGRVDDEGFLYIVDRAKDIIIRGGENIASMEVEAALYQHAAVAEASVFAYPHPTLGEEVAAVVRLWPGAAATDEELRNHVAERIASFKVPSHVWFVGEPFPRNAAGKVLKRELQGRFVAAAGAPQ
jgi:long-chain acyl-CoA synthetase